jgi:hypothetical protein
MRENVSLAGDRIGWWLSGGTDYVAPTELKTILGVGFYKYAAPNGAKSCCRGDGDSGSNRIDDVRPRVAPPEAPAERYICRNQIRERRSGSPSPIRRPWIFDYR